MFHAPRRRQARERDSSVRRNRSWRPTAESLESRLVLATFPVTNPSDNLLPGSLRYAITQANLPGNEGSTVAITPQVAGPIVLTGGELSITSSMTIRNDSGAPLEVRQSTPGARVFHITADPRALNVTITGVSSATPVTIDGGSVTGGNGGGIETDNPGSTLTLSYVKVSGNGAAARGPIGGRRGGVFAAGRVALDHTSVEANTAT